MSDISMCVHHKCPIRMCCHRYTAIPNKVAQAYTAHCAAYDSGEELLPISSNDCDSFWDNKGYRNDIRDEKIIRRGHG